VHIAVPARASSSPICVQWNNRSGAPLRNTLKTTFLLTALTLLLVLAGGYFGGQNGMILAFLHASTHPQAHGAAYLAVERLRRADPVIQQSKSKIRGETFAK